MVGIFLSTFCLVLAASNAALSDSDTSSFEETLSLLEQRDFSEYLRYTFVLGDRRSASGAPDQILSGLYHSQKIELDRLEELLEFQTAQASNDISTLIDKQIDQVLSLDQAVIDWTYEFRLKIGNHPEKLSGFYQQALHHLSEGSQKTYREVMRALASEIDRKLFEIRYPMIAEFVPLERRKGKFPFSRTELESLLQEKRFSEQDSSLSLLIFDHSTRSPWTPNWEKSWRETRDLLAPTLSYVWAEQKFAPALKLKASPTLDLDTVKRTIDDFVDENLDSKDKFHFEAAVEEFARPHWSKRGIKRFSYYELGDEHRNLFCARSFPDLNLKYARALIELQFFSLTESERFQIAKEIYTSSDDLLEYSGRYSKLDLSREEQVQAFHEILVLDYFKARTAPPLNLIDLTTRPLLDGRRLPDIELSRAKKARSLLEEYKEPSVLNELKDWWAIEFAPYDGFWRDESARFLDQWKRRELIRDQRLKITELEKKFEKAETDSERIQIAGEVSKILGDFPSDPESPAVFLATFLSGATPRHADEIVSSVKMFGLGCVFFVISKFTTGKVALSIVGLLGLRDIYRTGRKLAEAKTLFDRLQATEDLGKMTKDLISMGAGFGVAARTIDFSLIVRLRKMDSLRERIRKCDRQIEIRKAEIDTLTKQLASALENQSKIESRFGPGSTEFKDSSKEIGRLRLQIAQLQSGLLSNHQSLFEFYARRLAAEALNLAGGLSLPLRRSKSEPVVRKTMAQRFRRSEYLGIDQYKQMIEYFRRLEEQEQVKAFVAEAKPAAFIARFLFKRSLSKFQKAQGRLAENLSIAEESFLRAEKILADSSDEGAKRLAAEALIRGTKALKKSVLTFGEHTEIAGDLSTLARGSLKELQTLAELEKSEAQFSDVQDFLQLTESLRQMARLRPREGTETFPFPQKANEFTRRFFSENYLRLRRQLRDLARLHQEVSQKIADGSLPVDATAIETLEGMKLHLKAHQKAVDKLFPLFDMYSR
jgi:hypothetical protein